MALVHRGTIGILPAGALGVAFYFHLTDQLRNVDERVFFMGREGSASAAALREHGRIQIAHCEVAHANLWTPDLLTCAEAGFLPEMLLVCTQPDQLLNLMGSAVRLLERLAAQGSLDEHASELPTLILSSNGIYFQRVRQFLIEKLEEATLFGRLPDLWPDRMPHIVGKLLRGVTIQTGQREGSGPGAIYRPGPSGRTRIAGGAAVHRERAAALLTERGGWFEAVAQSPTRVEFDKALVNLTVNLLGQLRAIADDGSFRLLTIREIITRRDDPEVRELAEEVVAVGRAVRAYGPEDDFQVLLERMLGSASEHLDHVPSSLQWIAQQLRLDTLEAQVSPTERWLLEPLIRYAEAAGLDHASAYFRGLTQRVEQRLALAIQAALREPGVHR